LKLKAHSRPPTNEATNKCGLCHGKIEDAYHIAISTVNDLDVLTSWNYKHLANINKERKVAAVNIQEGYLHPLRFTTPMEVMG